jgi:hypothetical protein
MGQALFPAGGQYVRLPSQSLLVLRLNVGSVRSGGLIERGTIKFSLGHGTISVRPSASRNTRGSSSKMCTVRVLLLFPNRCPNPRKTKGQAFASQQSEKKVWK